MIVKFLMIAEIEVENEEAAIEEAQDTLDEFREAVRPAAEYGIVLYRASDPSHLTQDLMTHGSEVMDRLSKSGTDEARAEERGLFDED